MGQLTRKFFLEITSDLEHVRIGLEDLIRLSRGLDIPKDKNYPEDSVQCSHCGGGGCPLCQDKGWLTPKNHPDGRRCERELCSKPLPPNYVAIYCTNECARLDA
jgi:hypothetical protein